MDASSAPDYSSIWTTYLHHVSHRLGFVDAGGIRTRYIQAGPADAPAVVMVHGTGGSLENYTANLGPLSAHFNCVAFDCVGCGMSDKPDIDYEIPVYVRHLAATMDALGIRHAALMGNSLGGWISSAFALAHPDRVSKLVLMSSSGLLLDAENSARIQAGRTRAVDDPSWDNIQRVFQNLIVQEQYRIPDLVGLRQHLYRQPGMKQAVRHVLAIQDEGVRERNVIPAAEWRRIAVPTLVVVGLGERKYYIDTAHQLVQLIPDSDLLEIPVVGHWAMFEAAEAFNAAALAFLTKA